MSKLILVIEDSRTEALRTRLILEHEGYQVSLAADGTEGLAQAVQHSPDLILLDAVMPQMSAFQVYGKLKFDPKTSNIPIILLGGEADVAQLPSGQMPDCFLIKPYEPAMLAAKIKQMIEAPKIDGPATGDMETLRAELQKAQTQVDTANKARGEFLANMSHELRTPLHEIMGMVDLALATDSGAEQHTYLETARTSSNALLTLISDILEFSELESGQFTLDAAKMDPWEPVEKMTEVMAPRAKEKGLQFSSYRAPDVPQALVGDGKRLRQILGNLVSNAIKFTSQGEITIRLGMDRLQDGKAVLHYTVSDTGIGIPTEKQQTLFQPFRQADTTATRRYGGMGLGLVMARDLVQLMDGRLWVESEGISGKGTTLHFTVTLECLPEKLPMSQAVEAEKRSLTLQILLAEDSPTNQLIAVSNLKKAGHKVTVADNGLKAVQAFEQAAREGMPSSFDLVLMDVAMPEMDGIDATRAIREKEKEFGGHIPIIAMTAFTTKEYHDKCFAAGMDAYVSKPVRMEELNKTMEPLLAKST